LEAWIYLAGARLMLAVVPFRRLVWTFKRQPSTRALLTDGERHCLHLNVRWAISRARAYLPGLTACFPVGIAAQALLRRRGVEATLYYGAATRPETGLSAHVWVLDGTQGVVGHAVAKDYRIIARYP
jgi:hypothetical protein